MDLVKGELTQNADPLWQRYCNMLQREKKATDESKCIMPNTYLQFSRSTPLLPKTFWPN